MDSSSTVTADGGATAQSRRLIRGTALAALSAACFGSMVLFGRWAYVDGVSPTTLLFLRFAIAAPVLAALALARGSVWPSGRDLALCGVMGFVFVGNSLAYFVALTKAPASTVAILFFLYPALVVLGCRILWGEQLTWRKMLAVFMACGGAMITVGPSRLNINGGAALAILAAGIYTCYVLLARAQRECQDPLAQAAIIAFICAVIFGAMSAHEGWAVPQSVRGWTTVLALALLSTVVALSAFLGAVALAGPSRSAVISAVEPAVAAMLAVLFLGESLRVGMIVGLGLVVGAAALVVNTADSTTQADRPRR